MAEYSRYGTAAGLFEIGAGVPFQGNMLYHTATEFGIRYADGSKAYFSGSGLVWDEAAGIFTSGIVTAIDHFSGGDFTDSLEGLSLSAALCQALFEAQVGADALRKAIFSGDDILDGRYRPEGVVEDLKFIGYDGDDLIYGGAGNDLLGGEAGDDDIRGGAGDDRIFGGSGHDTLTGGDGDDRINAGSGDDVMKGGDGRDILHGSDGNDTYIGGHGLDIAVYTRSFHDLVITPTRHGFSIIEPHGVDSLWGIERLACDDGEFVFSRSTSSWSMISDTPGDLLLNPGSSEDGTAAGETIDLEASGKTMARGFGGADKLYGTTGFEALFGGNGSDRLFGDHNNTRGSLDRLHGGKGSDQLYGQAGNDILYGGDGKDFIAGGIGDDELTGGAGADTFAFLWKGGAKPQTWGHDVVRDFVIGTDRIALTFSKLPEGTGVTPDFYQVDGGAMITLAGAGSILLEDVEIGTHTLWDLLV